MRRILLLILSASAMATGANADGQSSYPGKPVRMVVHFAAGGPTDIVARVVSQKLSEAWSKPVVVENVPGAAGNIGADRVAKAPADGYTLLFASSSLAVNVTLHENLTYNLVRDFAPVLLVASTPFVLVVENGLAVKSVPELIAFAKVHPGTLTFASSGTGSASHLSGELFNAMAGVETRHVPYKGTTSAIPDLIGARVSMTYATPAAILPMVREGKLRALAVTSTKRLPEAPELPTVAESGVPGFEAGTWFGLLAPAKTPLPIVRKLHSDTAAILARDDVRKRLDALGMQAVGDSPEEFAAFIRSDVAKWAKVIKTAGVKAE